jgi:hypothetical protein
LKFNKDSWIISKIYNNGTLEKEDIVKNDNIEKYLTTSHNIDLNKFDINLEKEYCASEKFLSFSSFIYDKKYNNDIIIKNKIYYESLWNKTLIEQQKNRSNIHRNKVIQGIIKNKDFRNIIDYISDNNDEKKVNKIAIFFDNSASIDENNLDNKYSEIFKKIKNYNWKIQDVDLYSYNSKIEKILDIDDIKYWGNSNITSVTNYIENNNFKNKRIIIITDDDNYDIWIKENKNINFTNLTSNEISVIQIGNNVRKYKSEFNNILSATNWNIYNLLNNENSSSVIDKIFSKESNNLQIVSCDKEYNNDRVNKVLAWFISNKILSEISNNQDWEIIARKQTLLAEKYWIVNQFNSYIALETERQQRDLDRYSEEYDKYDTEYKNYWKIKESSNNGIRVWNIRFENSITNSNIDFWMDMVKNNTMDYWRSEWSDFMGWNNWWMSFIMSWRSNLSLYWIILILIYLAEFYSIISFIIKYRKSWKDENIEEEKIEETDVWR